MTIACDSSTLFLNHTHSSELWTHLHPISPNNQVEQWSVNINTGHNNIRATYTWAAPQENIFSLEERCGEGVEFLVESDVKLLMAHMCILTLAKYTVKQFALWAESGDIKKIYFLFILMQNIEIICVPY